MAKGKRSGQAEAQKRKSRPYKARSKAPEGSSVGEQTGREDWEDAVCPICLESPHNAVLLMCSSHVDGCRPYMCNTSHRHSNCLDLYQKSQVGLLKYQHSAQAVSESDQQRVVADSFHAGDTLNVRLVDGYSVPPTTHRRPLRGSINSLENASDDVEVGSVIIEALNSRFVSAGSAVTIRGQSRSVLTPHFSSDDIDPSGLHFLDLETGSDMEGSEGASSMNADSTGSSSSKSKHLVCPLCRGQVFGWHVINPARKYFNGKARSCSHESCAFAGTYQELRVHARCEHPCAQPCDVDPSRQRDWLHMERQREIGDVLSMIGVSSEDANNDDGHWWPYLVLLNFFEGMISQVRDHQAGSRRAASARLRDFMENLNRAASPRFRELIDLSIYRAVDGANTASGSGSMGEQSNHPLPTSRQHRHRRGMN